MFKECNYERRIIPVHTEILLQVSFSRHSELMNTSHQAVENGLKNPCLHEMVAVADSFCLRHEINSMLGPCGNLQTSVGKKEMLTWIVMMITQRTKTWKKKDGFQSVNAMAGPFLCKAQAQRGEGWVSVCVLTIIVNFWNGLTDSYLG